MQINFTKEDLPLNPLILLKEKVYRGNVTSSIYEFQYSPKSDC